MGTPQKICQDFQKTHQSCQTIHSIHDLSVRHPTRQSCEMSVRPSERLYTILPRPSDPLPLSHHLYDTPTSPSDHPPLSHCLYDTPISPSACLPPSNCLTATSTCTPIHTSSPTIHRTQDSSQSLAVVKGEQSHKAEKFHRAFTNYDLLLHALDASSIYLCDLRCVAPPKSGDDVHGTCGKCDFGGATLNNPCLCFSYVLPRLWDPGGVRS